MMTSKLSLFGFAWVVAFLISIGFRFWGQNHPEPLQIRLFIVWTLVFGPSILIGLWIWTTATFSSDI